MVILVKDLFILRNNISDNGVKASILMIMAILMIMVILSYRTSPIDPEW